MEGPEQIPFNFQKFMHDNGIAGVTIGTLLGFASQKVFDTFREEFLEPGLNTLYQVIFDSVENANTKMLAVLIEYSVVILIVYAISRFILFPALYPEILEDEQEREGGKAKMKHIVRSLDQIERIL
jgi:large-conductance mechanosensitive channel